MGQRRASRCAGVARSGAATRHSVRAGALVSGVVDHRALHAGAAFGAGASGTVFGARGSSSFFSRATAVCATAFFVSSLTLAYLSSQANTAPASLLDEAPVVETPAEEAPELSEEMPVSDLPSLEPSEESTDLPSLEEPATADEE